jgi:hypothetical protein
VAAAGASPWPSQPPHALRTHKAIVVLLCLLGLLMNTRGLVEVTALNIGLTMVGGVCWVCHTDRLEVWA